MPSSDKQSKDTTQFKEFIKSRKLCSTSEYDGLEQLLDAIAAGALRVRLRVHPLVEGLEPHSLPLSGVVGVVARQVHDVNQLVVVDEDGAWDEALELPGDGELADAGKAIDPDMRGWFGHDDNAFDLKTKQLVETSWPENDGVFIWHEIASQ